MVDGGSDDGVTAPGRYGDLYGMGNAGRADTDSDRGDRAGLAVG